MGYSEEIRKSGQSAYNKSVPLLFKKGMNMDKKEKLEMLQQLSEKELTQRILIPLHALSALSSMKSKKVIDMLLYNLFIIRGKKVMLDKDLASLYGVETKILNRAIKRNMKRFPEDFMFQLTKEEFNNLRFHFGISRWGGQRYLPHVFTENGVAMLLSVLNSKRAIAVNIQIMRTFTKIREMLATHKELKQKIEEMEKKYDYQFKVVFEAIKQLIEPSQKRGKRIGLESLWRGV